MSNKVIKSQGSHQPRKPGTGGTVSFPPSRPSLSSRPAHEPRRLLPRRFDAKSVGLKIPAEAGRSSLTLTQRSPAAARSNFLVTCDRARGREGRRSKGRPGGGRLAQRERRGVRVTGEFEASRIPGSHVLGAQSIGENVPPHRPGRTLCLTLLLSRQQSCLCLAFDFSLPPSLPPSDVFCVFLSSFFVLLTSMYLFGRLSPSFSFASLSIQFLLL